jgi:hypothetical protein
MVSLPVHFESKNTASSPTGWGHDDLPRPPLTLKSDHWDRWKNAVISTYAARGSFDEGLARP